MSYPEEDFDRLERKVNQLEEEFVQFCFIVQNCEDLVLVRAAAGFALEALKGTIDA